MGGINDIKVALQEYGVRSVTMRYDPDGDDQVFSVETKNGSTEICVPAGVQTEQIIEFIRAQIEQANAPDVEPMPDLGPKLGLVMAPDTPEQRRIDEAFAGKSRIIPLVSVPEPQRAQVERAIEQIKAGDYDLVPDEEPEPKPALFFCEPKEGEHQ